MARSFSARNVVASVLLGTIPPRMSSGRLVALAEAFDIAAGTTRVALSRMVERGELVNDGGVYELTGPLLARQRRQEAALAPRTRAWDGSWELYVVRPGGRSSHDRAALRQSARHLGLAERREGVWLRPDNLDPARLAEDRAVLEDQTDRFVARPAGPDPPVAELFDLDGWATTARSLREAMAETIGALRADDHTVLAPTFELSAAIVRHLVDDPVLPAELVPGDWPADALREDYRAYNAAYRHTLADFFAHV